MLSLPILQSVEVISVPNWFLSATIEIKEMIEWLFPICVRYQATGKQGHQSITAQSKMFNTSEKFKEKSKINRYQIAYR